MTLVDSVAQVLERHTSRRGLLVKSALVGSALAVGPLEFALKPGTAYAFVCRCGNPACGCGSPCCDGYTEFCCTLHGANVCPSGTFAGGWWKADGSSYCAGPRYYVDCHSECQCDGGCQPGGFAFCGPGCDGLDCGCGNGDCGNRLAGCISFRYGQCHQEIACVGRIACRVVTCTPAYLLDNSCTTTSYTDNNTAQHNRACLQDPPRVGRAYGSATPLPLSDAARSGTWLVGPDGGVFAYGGARFFGSMGGRPLNRPMVAMASTPDGQGYWTVATDGGIFSFGSARFLGSMGGRRLNAPMVAMASTPDGQGYWTVASDGGIFAFGSAKFFGSMGAVTLESPVVGIACAPDAQGYWMVASDGGIFAFGSAGFHGSMGGQALNALIGGIVPTPSGSGYWLWGQDGSVYAFGDAPMLGSYRTVRPPPPPALPGGGVDSFYAFVPRVARSGTAPSHNFAVLGYTLWAVSPLGPPPGVLRYLFTSG